MGTGFLGSLSIPDDTPYGIKTARASQNFQLHGRHTRLGLIYAIVTVKEPTSLANTPSLPQAYAHTAPPLTRPIN